MAHEWLLSCQFSWQCCTSAAHVLNLQNFLDWLLASDFSDCLDSKSFQQPGDNKVTCYIDQIKTFTNTLFTFNSEPASWDLLNTWSLWQVIQQGHHKIKDMSKVKENILSISKSKYSTMCDCCSVAHGTRITYLVLENSQFWYPKYDTQ